MNIRNWKDLKPVNVHEGTGFGRDYFRTRNSPWWEQVPEDEREKTLACDYLEFVAHFTVMPGVKLHLHRHNYEEVYIVLHGKGLMQVENEKEIVNEGDGIYIPAQAAHTVHSLLPDQPIILLCVGVPDPQEKELWIREVEIVDGKIIAEREVDRRKKRNIACKS
jgi:mannose-6-phosphate isomerase-like protein (cupin superfamily)